MEAPLTKESAAYHMIKEHILRGNLPADKFISQRSLAELADSNVVTVRAALKRLEKDGLMEYVPKWGFRIPLDTRETLTDRFYVRKILETAAVLRIIDLNLLDMNKENGSLRSAVIQVAELCDSIDSDPEGKASDYASAHFKLHQLIVDAAGSPLLSSTFSRITLIGLFYMNTRAMWHGSSERYHGDHVSLVETILSGDRERSAKALTRHIDEGMENQLRCLAEEGR